MQLKDLSQHFFATLDGGVANRTLAIRTLDTPEGSTLAVDQVAELLKQVRAGEFAGPLIVEATTYIQRATPNRNATRFKSGTLRSGAKSFAGQVVLLDHDQRSQQSRIGTILKSRAEKVGDEVHFVQTLAIVKPHAMESVLDGTIDRFSIGWFPTGMVECSAHKGPMFGPGCCDCWPGDVVNGKPVEAVFTAWEGIEVSAVNVPAVVGTGIDQIRAALSALRSGNESGEKPRNPTKETTMNIRALLGLADTATDDEVKAEVARRDAESKSLSSKLATHEAAQVATEQQLAAAKAQRLDTEIAAAKADGRLHIVRDATGKEIESQLEGRIRGIGKVDVDSAISLLGAMQKSHPNGNPSALQSSLPAAPVAAPSAVASTALENMLPLMGLDAKDVADFGPQHRKASPKNAPVPRHLSKLFATRNIGDDTTR